MTEYVYKLKNGKAISAYEDEKGNISITKEALEIMVNSWDDGYHKGYSDGCLEGRADAEEDAENRKNRILDDEKRLAYEQGKVDAIDECFKKIEQRLNDDTEISFDLPVEEVLGEDIDMDDFLMLADEIVQEYKRLIFSKSREAKYQLREQK